MTELLPRQKREIEQVEEAAGKFKDLLVEIGDGGREMALANTKIDEAVLWAKESIATR